MVMPNGFAQAGNALGQAFFGGQPDTAPQAMDAAARTAYVMRRAQQQREQAVAANQLLQTIKDPQERLLIESRLGNVFAQTQLGLGRQDTRRYNRTLFNESQQKDVPWANLAAGTGVVNGKIVYPNASGGYGETYNRFNGQVTPGPLTGFFAKKLSSQANKSTKPANYLTGKQIRDAFTQRKVDQFGSATGPYVTDYAGLEAYTQSLHGQPATAGSLATFMQHYHPAKTDSTAPASTSKFVNGQIYRDAQGNLAKYENGQWVPVSGGG